MVFARPDRDPQTVVYFRAQAEDAAIGKRPGVLAFLKQDAPYPTFLKSASYLLHGGDFSIVRQIVLTHSRLVLEDDSGIPLRFFKAPRVDGDLLREVRQAGQGLQLRLPGGHGQDLRGSERR